MVTQDFAKLLVTRRPQGESPNSTETGQLPSGTPPGDSEPHLYHEVKVQDGTVVVSMTNEKGCSEMEKPQTPGMDLQMFFDQS